MKIDLPWPDRILWPNGPQARNRGHMASGVQKHRTWAHMATLEALGRTAGFTPARIIIHVHAKPKGPLPDRDNCIAACKALFDGIADGLGTNDRFFPTPEVEFAQPREGRIVVEVFPPVDSDIAAANQCDVKEKSGPDSSLPLHTGPDHKPNDGGSI